MKNQETKDSRQHKHISRRGFVKATAAATAAFTIVPRHVLGAEGGVPPSERLNIAVIGVGGMGKKNIAACVGEKGEENSGVNIVALCDVDFDYAAPVFEAYPKAKKYKDYRQMLEKQKDIDAVIVATPDHTHAVIAMAAMQLGKHVYVQKPLTHSIYEARILREAAKRYRVVTQMGNQGHSSEDIRLICEWIWDGAIGEVREVHAWTDRPGGRWARELRGLGAACCSFNPRLGPLAGLAPERPYNPAYQPFKWRGFWDFGTGSLGDMACHIMDPGILALKLGHPTSVEAASSVTVRNNTTLKETAPVASIVRYKYPARGSMPPVKLTWYDGGLMPETPEELEPGRKMGDKDGGVLFMGEKGIIMCGTCARSPRIVPETKMKEYKLPPRTLPRVEGSHEQDWIDACKSGKEACSNFEVAGPMTEAVLVGNIAIRTGKQLLWDGENMRFTNNDEANEYVNPPAREGWATAI